MATQSAQQLSANRMRLFKDRFARYGVTAGGVMVLVALLLIFFYLLYVVQPIFESVSLKKVNSFNLPESGQVEAVGMEEQAEIGYRFLRSGELQFFSLIDKNDRRSGDILLSETFVEPENVSSFAKTLPVNHQYVYGLE